MTAWTTRQEAILRELGHLGVDAVREALRRECGVERSRAAVEAHASRIHASLKVRRVCPECGAVGVRLVRQGGLCPRCTELAHLREEIAFNELLMDEREAAAGGAEVAEVRRERDAMRKRNSRLCRKYGLATRRERLRGAAGCDIVTGADNGAHEKDEADIRDGGAGGRA